MMIDSVDGACSARVDPIAISIEIYIVPLFNRLVTVFVCLRGMIVRS